MSSSRRSSAGTSTWDRLAGLGERKLQNSMQVEIVDGGAVRRRSRPGGGRAREPRHLRRGHRLGARIVGHTAQHAQSGTGAVGVLTAATPTAPVSTSVTSESLSKIASSAVLLFVVIDIPQTLVGSISIVKKVGK
jgi:hypothetical protein